MKRSICQIHIVFSEQRNVLLTALKVLTVTVKFPLEHATKAQRESRSISFLNLGAGCGWVINATPRTLYPYGRPGTHCTSILYIV